MTQRMVPTARLPGCVMAMKIYVRERIKIGEGVRQPRFIILAVSGGDLKVYAHHFRKTELEQIASDCGADLVYLEPMPDAEHGSKNPA
jgi:hypothetical protein